MKIFVTGGTGFIGSHVIKYLANTNYQIIALRRPGSKFRIRSVNSPSWIEKEINEINISDLKGIDSIIHLATAGVSPQKASWEELTEVNVNFGIKLIELAKNAGVRRFITSGTCMEYGNEHNYERIPPNASLNPNNPYAASKAAGFQILNAFAREENIELFYGRIFTAFGEGQFKKNLWPSLKNAAYKGIDFEINSANQIRDFISVELVASHICKALIRDDIQINNPKVVNIGSGIPMNVYQFAFKEWSKFNANGKLKVKDSFDEPSYNNMVADIKGLNF